MAASNRSVYHLIVVLAIVASFFICSVGHLLSHSGVYPGSQRGWQGRQPVAWGALDIGSLVLALLTRARALALTAIAIL